MSATTLQRVRQLQEEIRQHEEMLKALTQTPEYIAEQEFVKDIQDVLEIHGRTMREAVLAIDPSLLGSMPDRQQKPKRPYKPRKPKDIEPFHLTPEPKPAPAPKPSPFASFGQGGDSSASPAAPESAIDEAQAQFDQAAQERTEQAQPVKPAKPAKPPKKKRDAHNAKRDAARRLECIKTGTWFLYTNPHTGEKEEASGTRTDVLRAWVAEYGKAVVEGWKVPVTADEAGL